MTENTDNEQPQKSDTDRAPSIRLQAFCCPHCDVYTHQTWQETFAKTNEDLPFLGEILEGMLSDEGIARSEKERFGRILARYKAGQVFIDEDVRPPGRNVSAAANLSLSKCFTCKAFSVWVYDRLVWPPHRTGPEPNVDLPPEIKVDFEEARSILDLSPRGAAGLLRLCVEKLCIHLEAEGDKLDNRIADLVAKGLDVRVQQSLDAVRVIGNEAVHPGQMDMTDNRDTAEALFKLVNLIAEKMISEPAHVAAVYDTLPQTKREAIERRDRTP